jgi:hypothetical protein
MIERRETICRRHANWNGIQNELRVEKVFNFAVPTWWKTGKRWRGN